MSSFQIGPVGVPDEIHRVTEELAKISNTLLRIARLLEYNQSPARAE